MLDFSSNSVLSIPRPQHGLTPFVVDLTFAYQGEAKLQEIATATQTSAPYLASVFSRAYASLGRAFGALIHEVGSQTIASRKRRARIILDLAPHIAKEKGLSSARSPTGSEDVREAICYSDEEYCAVEEYRAALEAVKELVFIKLQAMRMGYEATRAIIRGTSSSAGNQVHDLGTDESQDVISRAMEAIGMPDTESAPPPKPEVESSPDQKPRYGFGKPR